MGDIAHPGLKSAVAGAQDWDGADGGGGGALSSAPRWLSERAQIVWGCQRDSRPSGENSDGPLFHAMSKN